MHSMRFCSTLHFMPWLKRSTLVSSNQSLQKCQTPIFHLICGFLKLHQHYIWPLRWFFDEFSPYLVTDVWLMAFSRSHSNSRTIFFPIFNNRFNGTLQDVQSLIFCLKGKTPFTWDWFDIKLPFSRNRSIHFHTGRLLMGSWLHQN